MLNGLTRYKLLKNSYFLIEYQGWLVHYEALGLLLWRKTDFLNIVIGCAVYKISNQESS